MSNVVGEGLKVAHQGRPDDGLDDSGHGPGTGRDEGQDGRDDGGREHGQDMASGQARQSKNNRPTHYLLQYPVQALGRDRPNGGGCFRPGTSPLL